MPRQEDRVYAERALKNVKASNTEASMKLVVALREGLAVAKGKAKEDIPPLPISSHPIPSHPIPLWHFSEISSVLEASPIPQECI